MVGGCQHAQAFFGLDAAGERSADIGLHRHLQHSALDLHLRAFDASFEAEQALPTGVAEKFAGDGRQEILFHGWRR